MIFDLQSLFSDGQSLAGPAGVTPSENVIDRGALVAPQHAVAAFKADLGKGTDVPLRIQVTETFVGGTNLLVAVQVATDAAFTTPITVTTGATVPTADLVAGYVFAINRVPLNTDEQFIRLRYSTTGTFTAGRITAGITLGNEAWFK